MTNPQSQLNNSDTSSAHAPGSQLKQARIAQGISLDAVQEATKIPMDALKAIEEGYKVRSLSPFYLRGFMKMYAKYLGLDPNDIIADLPKPAVFEVTPSAKEEETAVSQQRADLEDLQKETWMQKVSKVFDPAVLKFLLVAVVAIVLAVAAVRLTVAGVKALGQLFTKKSNSSQVQKSKNRDAAKNTKEKSKDSAQKPTQIPDVQREKSVAVPAAEKESSATASKMVTLTVRATKDSWFQVKADGKLVYQSTMRSGRSESWTAKESIDVSGKNINQLEYEVNGRFIGALGRKDRQAKRLIITKDGMNVTQ